MAAARGYAAFAAAHPHLFKLMFSDERMGAEDGPASAEASDSYAVLREVAEGLDADWRAPLPGNLSAELFLWSFAHGFAHLAANGALGKAAEAGCAPPTVDNAAPRFRYRRGAPPAGGEGG